MAAENKVKWVIIIETPLTHDTFDHYVYLKRKRILNVSVTTHNKTQLAPEILR